MNISANGLLVIAIIKERERERKKRVPARNDASASIVTNATAY